jgi:hypothetical protein
MIGSRSMVERAGTSGTTKSGTTSDWSRVCNERPAACESYCRVMQTGLKAGRQAGRQEGRPTGRRAGMRRRQAGRQSGGQTSRQTSRQAGEQAAGRPACRRSAGQQPVSQSAAATTSSPSSHRWRARRPRGASSVAPPFHLALNSSSTGAWRDFANLSSSLSRWAASCQGRTRHVTRCEGQQSTLRIPRRGRPRPQLVLDGAWRDFANLSSYLSRWAASCQGRIRHVTRCQGQQTARSTLLARSKAGTSRDKRTSNGEEGRDLAGGQRGRRQAGRKKERRACCWGCGGGACAARFS